MRSVMSLGLNLGPRLSVDDNSTQTLLLVFFNFALDYVKGNKSYTRFKICMGKLSDFRW